MSPPPSEHREALEAHRSKIVKDAVLVLEGEVQPDEFAQTLKLRAERVYTIEEARQRFGGDLLVDLSAIPEVDRMGDLSARLRACLEPHRRARTGCPVELLYLAAVPGGSHASGRIRLGPEWHVNPSDDLLERLRAEFGAERVSLRYAAG